MSLAIYRKQAGSSLLEVLIALFVLAVGMLGVLAMQTTAVKTSRSASLYSQAQLLAMQMYEAMQLTSEDDRANYVSADGASDPGCSTPGANCSGQDIVQWNVYQWVTAINNSLPGGSGVIQQIAGTDSYTISVSFDLGYEEDAGTGAVAAQTDTVELMAVF